MKQDFCLKSSEMAAPCTQGPGPQGPSPPAACTRSPECAEESGYTKAFGAGLQRFPLAFCLFAVIVLALKPKVCYLQHGEEQEGKRCLCPHRRWPNE